MTWEHAPFKEYANVKLKKTITQYTNYIFFKIAKW